MSVNSKNGFSYGRISLVALGITVLASCGGGQGGMKMGDSEFAVMTLTADSSNQTKMYPATIKGLQDIEIRPQVSGFIVKLFIKSVINLFLFRIPEKLTEKPGKGIT